MSTRPVKLAKLLAAASLALAGAALTAPLKSGAAAVTYSKDIAPILYQRCASCHRPGEVAPFSLLGYRDAAKRARQLAEVTRSRYMPPWKPEPGYGEFHDARRLKEEEIALIARWAETGAVEGDPADLPPAPKFADGWQLGEPDLVLEMAQPYMVKADGPDIYQCFVVPMDLAGDRHVAAVEFRPGNRRVVHHALFFLDTTGEARRRDAADPEPGYRSFGGIGFLPTGGLGGWAPGAFPRFLPEGVARVLKRGSDLVLQMHYHPSGKPESDRSVLGVYFSKTPPRKVASFIPLVQRRLDIPPGEKRYRAAVAVTVPIDVEAFGITPHMHLIGREMKVTATLPDGARVPLLWVKDWNFNWQDQYLYARPVRLPAGTRVEMEAHYDNSADNPRNPSDPPRRVGWGEQTTDEMALCGVQVVAANQAELGRLLPEVVRQLMVDGLRK